MFENVAVFYIEKLKLNLRSKNNFCIIFYFGDKGKYMKRIIGNLVL